MWPFSKPNIEKLRSNENVLGLSKATRFRMNSNRESHAAIRTAAVKSLGEIDKEGAVTAILGVLECQGSTRLHTQALQALSGHKRSISVQSDNAAIGILSRFVCSEDSVQRDIAINLLLRANKSIEVLNIFQSETRKDVHLSIINTLGKLATDEVHGLVERFPEREMVETVISHFVSDDDADAAICGISLLQKLTGKRAWPHFVSALEHPDGRVRSCAADALGEDWAVTQSGKDLVRYYAAIPDVPALLRLSGVPLAKSIVRAFSEDENGYCVGVDDTQHDSTGDVADWPRFRTNVHQYRPGTREEKCVRDAMMYDIEEEAWIDQVCLRPNGVFATQVFIEEVPDLLFGLMEAVHQKHGWSNMLPSRILPHVFFVCWACRAELEKFAESEIARSEALRGPDSMVSSIVRRRGTIRGCVRTEGWMLFGAAILHLHCALEKRLISDLAYESVRQIALEAIQDHPGINTPASLRQHIEGCAKATSLVGGICRDRDSGAGFADLVPLRITHGAFESDRLFEAEYLINNGVHTCKEDHMFAVWWGPQNVLWHGELGEIHRVLQDSLHASEMLSWLEANGYDHKETTPVGDMFESKVGLIILYVRDSDNDSRLFAVTYSPKDHDKRYTVVEDGELRPLPEYCERW